MKFDPKSKIESCVSRDKGRYAMQTVFFDGERLIATDGRVLAVLPVESEEGDTPGSISTEALVLARKVAPRKGVATLRCNGVFNVAGQELPRVEDGEFPRWESVMPNPATSTGPRVFLAREFLTRALAALGDSSHIMIQFAAYQPDKSPVYFEAMHVPDGVEKLPAVGKGPRAVVMPVSLPVDEGGAEEGGAE